jgi:predicted HNH restriction endonuclease
VMSRGANSIDSIIKEIDKCLVICSNCHRKLHAGLIQLTTN